MSARQSRNSGQQRGDLGSEMLACMCSTPSSRPSAKKACGCVDPVVAGLSAAPRSASIVTTTLPVPRDLGSAKTRARRRLPF